MSGLLSSLSAGIQKEAQSFVAPPPREVAIVPQVGSPAPSSSTLRFPSGRPTIVAFLRHCGCPFAEKTFSDLVTLSNKYPKIRCVAVSHSSREATDGWIVEIGGQWDVEVIIDDRREIYSSWGLGLSSTWHLINPLSLVSSILLARNDGIWTRATESGTRWQTSGTFAVDRLGVVQWLHVARRADDLPPVSKAVEALNMA